MLVGCCEKCDKNLQMLTLRDAPSNCNINYGLMRLPATARSLFFPFLFFGLMWNSPMAIERLIYCLPKICTLEVKH